MDRNVSGIYARKMTNWQPFLEIFFPQKVCFQNVILIFGNILNLIITLEKNVKYGKRRLLMESKPGMNTKNGFCICRVKKG